MKRKILWKGLSIIFVTALFLGPGAVRGEKQSRENLKERVMTRPIEITAEELVADREKDRVIFKGSVVARQEDLVIYADELVAQYTKDGKEVDRIEARGNVKVVQGNLREATGDRAVFLNREQKIELTGNARVREGESTLFGEKLTIFLAENRSVIEGGEKGRVRAIINPEKFLEKKKEGGEAEGAGEKGR